MSAPPLTWEDWWHTYREELEQFCWSLHVAGTLQRAVISSWQMKAVAAFTFPLARVDLAVENAALRVRLEALQLQYATLVERLRIEAEALGMETAMTEARSAGAEASEES